MAGSGIRGQFEEKFKALIMDIEDEAGNVICFIDEVREYLRIHSVLNKSDMISVLQIRCSTWGRLKAALTQDK